VTAVAPMGCEVRSIVDAHRFRYTNEDELQEGLALALTRAGHQVEREVRLNDRDRIDLLVGTAGIEVKIAGQPGRVVEQLRRYAEHDRISELVLVTSRVRHQAPGALNGKAVTVICIAGHSL
jgi:hypothetical protein